LAVEVIQKHIREAQRNANVPIVGAYDRQFSPLTNRLASAIRLANQAIRDAAKSQPDQEGMGTTVVSAMLNGHMLSVAHVGDSRMYLIRGDTIEALTADHSLVAEQVRRGMLTEEEAERSPQKNIITRALGIDDAVDVDLDEVPLMQGDQLLLCSDGLTRDVKPAEILVTVRREKNPQAAAERLVELANAAGGLDNTTVILVTIQHGASETPMQRVWNWLVS
jgi:serine/threonine protein phosphatase PrpC